MISEKQIQTIVDNICEDLAVYLGNRNALVGLSGGIDSALVALICKQAIGARRVTVAMLPYGDQSTEDARALIDVLRPENVIEYNIKKIVDQFPDSDNKLILGNTHARVRMTLLYQFAAETKSLVVGTTNRTEAEIGYYTKWGDGAVDIEPIADLLKTEVRMAAKVLGVPQAILDKAPSANLWDGQTDEDELGVTYADMDQIIESLEMIGECSHPKTDKVKELIAKSAHKKVMPPALKVRSIDLNL